MSNQQTVQLSNQQTVQPANCPTCPKWTIIFVQQSEFTTVRNVDGNSTRCGIAPKHHEESRTAYVPVATVVVVLLTATLKPYTINGLDRQIDEINLTPLVRAEHEAGIMTLFFIVVIINRWCYCTS